MPSSFKGIISPVTDDVDEVCNDYFQSTFIFLHFSKTEQAIPGHDTMLIEEFEPDVFRQIIEYIHTSSLTLQPRTLLGKDNLSSKNKTINWISCKVCWMLRIIMILMS